jgi:hypothetical protein
MKAFPDSQFTQRPRLLSLVVRLQEATRDEDTFTGRATPMGNSEQCPRCGKGLVVHGSLPGTRGLARQLGFRPEELRFFALSLQFPEVPVSAGAAACASCGLVWTELDAGALRQKLRDLGNEDVQRRLGQLEGE